MIYGLVQIIFISRNFQTWTLRKVTGLLLVRASKTRSFYTLAMAGFCGWTLSISAGLRAGTPQGPGREAGVLI